MKHFFLIMAVIIVLPVFSWSQNQKQPDETGIFLDTVKVGAMELRLGITISKDENGAFRATLNSIDQSSGEIPFSSVNVEGRHIVLNSSIGVQIEGDYEEGFNSIVAEFRQGPGKFPLVFERVDALPVNKRPQEPKAPYPYVEEEVTFVNEKAGVTLAGTITFPQGDGPFPAVVLISGSGPQNRNEEILGHKPFWIIADYLTRNGIAVLRYDDRGIGKSTGNFRNASSGDFAEDALAGFEYLKSRTEINPKCIGLAGHSEGGIIAPIVASKSNDVAHIILLAGPGSNLGDNVIYQRSLIARKNGASEEYIQVQEKCYRTINEILRQDTPDETASEEIKNMYALLSEDEKSILNWSNEQLEQNAKMMLGNWWRFGLRYNPAETIRMVECPVLALLGEKDQQVPVALNQKELEEATADGNRMNKVVVVSGVNHLFQTCKTGEESEYAQIEETFSPKVMELMKNWIIEVQNRDM